MGGPEVVWRGGRLDHTDDSDVPPNGRLPDAALGITRYQIHMYET